METKRILVVEDEKDINRLIAHHLRQAGFEVGQVYDAEAALSMVHEHNFDLILLDILLPGMDGYELCQRLRRNAATEHIPVIFLTALSGEADRVKGLSLGGDDYLSKPFSPREMVSRVKANLRRVESKRAKTHSARIGDVAIDFLKHQIRVKGKAIHLTNSEFQLLKMLVAHEGRVFSRDELLAKIREQSQDLALGNVDVHVHRLRQKLEENPKRPKIIQTVRGIGYRFQQPDY